MPRRRRKSKRLSPERVWSVLHMVELAGGYPHRTARFVIDGRPSLFPSEEARREAWIEHADEIRARRAHVSLPIWAAERYGWPE